MKAWICPACQRVDFGSACHRKLIRIQPYIALKLVTEHALSIANRVRSSLENYEKATAEQS